MHTYVAIVFKAPRIAQCEHLSSNEHNTRGFLVIQLRNSQPQQDHNNFKEPLQQPITCTCWNTYRHLLCDCTFSLFLELVPFLMHAHMRDLSSFFIRWWFKNISFFITCLYKFFFYILYFLTLLHAEQLTECSKPWMSFSTFLCQTACVSSCKSARLVDAPANLAGSERHCCSRVPAAEGRFCIGKVYTSRICDRK